MRRKEPMSFAECWIGTAGDMGFDLEKIDQRIIELNRKSKVIKGNFVWAGNVVDSRVVFVLDDNGRWEISLRLDDSQTNQKVKTRIYNSRTNKYEWQWKGANEDRFSFGGDPVEWTNKTEAKHREDKSRQSNVSCVGLQERDLSIDKNDDPYTWTTRRFIAIYNYRPASVHEANEDILKGMVYYGGSLNVENNKTNLIQHFIERGYGGYLYVERDPKTGRPKDKPGTYATVPTLDELLSETKDYINYHVHHEEHLTYLRQCKNIRGREEITKYDVFAAGGWALVLSKRKTGGLYSKQEEPKERGITLQSFMHALRG
jgi:hypothetical protein